MYALNVVNADVRVVDVSDSVKESEIILDSVDDLANKLTGSKILIELYNKRTGEQVKKFSSRGNGLNRLWKAITDASIVSVARETKAVKVKAEGPRTGRLTGKKLKKLKETNPRRAGTFGWHSWNKYESGTLYEDAVKKGARPVDINWDLKHGYVEAVA
jgi:hypothetical protein